MTQEVGQITTADNLPVTWAIKSHEGKVVVLLDPIVRVNELDPQNALDIAEALSQAALECQGMKIAGQALKVNLAEKAAQKLVPRIMLMLKSMHKKPIRYQAEQITATCLSEVL